MSYRGGGVETWEIPPNLSIPPKILTCCHDLVMYNVILSVLNCLVVSSIHLMKTNTFQQHKSVWDSTTCRCSRFAPSSLWKNPVWIPGQCINSSYTLHIHSHPPSFKTGTIDVCMSVDYLLNYVVCPLSCPLITCNAFSLCTDDQ